MKSFFALSAHMRLSASLFALLAFNLDGHAAITATGDTYPTAGDTFWASGGGDQSIGVGGSTTGSLSITDGSTFLSSSANVAYVENSVGLVTVDDATWNNSRSISLGSYGEGSLKIINGGEVLSDTLNIDARWGGDCTA